MTFKRANYRQLFVVYVPPPCRPRRPTSGAVVLSYPELVQVLGVSQGELVVVGVDRLLPVLHVDPQLIAALGGHLLDVVQS